MMYKLILPIVIISLGVVISAHDSDSNDEEYDFLDIYDQNDSYRGEKFPQKYLSVEGTRPTAANLTTYIESLMRTVRYFTETANDTDPNVAIGLFFTKALLKRTLLDYGHKINDLEKRNVKKLIDLAEYIMSHFIYDCKRYGYDRKDLLFQLSVWFKHDEPVVHSIAPFNKHVMKKWIQSNIQVNTYIKEMDEITLCRYKYAQLATSMHKYYKICDSDRCISGISTHQLPIKYDTMVPCRWNEFCTVRVFKMPSSAYVLSHRLFYIAGLHLTRRCYILGEEIDKTHIDIMCANMYREAVYLARRGFFYRDLFLEHIALCGLFGYEEFHRNKWFKKIITWMDEDGCMMENRNFEINRTVIYMSRPNTPQMKKKLKKLKRKLMEDACQHHQMALLMIVLAHAIRFTAHYI